MPIDPSWRSEDGVVNSRLIRKHYTPVLAALAEIDALGQRVLQRAINDLVFDDLGKVIGVAMLRRAITHFIGVRHLLENAASQQALLVSRALYESYLFMRYLIHGGANSPSVHNRSSSRGREIRGRYYYVGSIRGEICRRQAMLDGAEGTRRVSDAGEREALAAEMWNEVSLMKNRYPTQFQRYGPLPCHKPDISRRRYHDSRKWYSFGFRSESINSVKALAQRLGQATDAYFVFYSPASELGHGAGEGHDLSWDDSEVGVHSPYSPDAFEFVAFWAGSWQELIIAHYCNAYHSPSLDDAFATAARADAVLKALHAEVPDGF